MVTIQDPTVAFSTVVARRRQARAAVDAGRFRLGVHGLPCGPSSDETGLRVVIGASAWALKSQQREPTLRTIGLVGGLLVDMGFQVCPIGADEKGPLPSLIVWVCGNETQADEYEQLAVIGVPGLSIGSCVEGLEAWGQIPMSELQDPDAFVRQFADEVSRLLERA
jgi:hypothetical protein